MPGTEWIDTIGEAHGYSISEDGRNISVTISRDGDYRMLSDWGSSKKARLNAHERGTALIARCDGSAVLLWRDSFGKIRQRTFKNGSAHFYWRG